MSRLLILNPTLGVGGVERKIADLVPQLAKAQPDLQLDLILEKQLPPDSPENVFSQLLAGTRVRLHFKPTAPFVPFFLYLLWQVLALKPDIVLAFSRRPSVLALTLRELLWWRKFRVIVGNDSIASRALALYVRQGWVRRILSTQMRWLYPRAALFLVPSDTSRRDLMEHFAVPPAKIRVLKNWTRVVPPQKITPAYDVIYVGRVDRVKQLTRLVEIVHSVQARLPDLRVVIVGDGDDMPNVAGMVHRYNLGHVFEFVGYRSDIGAWLAQARIFCLTSRFEGLPIAALEAMAYGLPVVTLAYPGAGELVQAGQTGFICADPAEFCDRLVFLLENETVRTRMGDQARAFVAQEHGDGVLAQYAQHVLQPDPLSDSESR